MVPKNIAALRFNVALFFNFLPTKIIKLYYSIPVGGTLSNFAESAFWKVVLIYVRKYCTQPKFNTIMRVDKIGMFCPLKNSTNDVPYEKLKSKY